jgi:hypothetical protein
LPGLTAPLVYTVLPIQQPLWQATELQIWPVPQFVPSVLLVHAVSAVPGWQVWQALTGLTAPLA